MTKFNDAVEAAGFTGDITGNVTGNVSGVLTGGQVLPVQVLTGDGAITIKTGLVILNKAGAIAATLADPTATTDDGKVLRILSVTAQAHTVTIAGGLNGSGASADVGTFSAAIGNGVTLVAYQGKWYLTGPNTNVTFA